MPQNSLIDIKQSWKRTTLKVNSVNTPQRPASPCINLCKMDDADQYCLGCQRTLDEIAAWSELSDAEKEVIWTELDKRRTNLHE
ncbi:MAG: DUF1289 domain-containing protein [Polynucleobacter victoriensis]